MEKILSISESLWIAVNDVHPDYDDGLFSIRDNVGGETMIDRDEISQLIEVLQGLQVKTEKVS